MSAGPADPAVRRDLRLVPPAVAAWLAALAVVHAPGTVVRLVSLPAAALACGALLTLLAATRHVVPDAVRADPGPPGPSPRRTARCLPALALSVATAAAVLVAGAGTAVARAPDVLVAAARDGRTVEVVGRVAAPPAPLGDRWRWTVSASTVHVDGAWWHVPAGVEVVAPASVAVDAQVRVHGTAAGGGRGGRVRVRAREAPVVTAAPRAPAARAAAVRTAAHAVAAPLPADVRGLLPAVTVGDTSAVPADLEAAMRTAGLAHLTAVSGAHFALLGALVLGVTAALRVPRTGRVVAVVAAGAGLLLVVGPEPSVVRAAVMGAVGLVGLLAGRRAAGPAALAAAVVVLLVADPWLSVEPGFALSVAATAGLVVLGGPLVERWSARCGREGAALLAAPVVAQVGCLPVALGLWPTLGPWGAAANVVVAPAVAPATLLGLAAALLHGVWPAAAGLLASLAGAALWWVARVARWAADLPGAAVAWWPGPVGVGAALLVAVGVGALVLRPAAPRDAPRGPPAGR